MNPWHGLGWRRVIFNITFNVHFQTHYPASLILRRKQKWYFKQWCKYVARPQTRTGFINAETNSQIKVILIFTVVILKQELLCSTRYSIVFFHWIFVHWQQWWLITAWPIVYLHSRRLSATISSKREQNKNTDIWVVKMVFYSTVLIL